MVFTTYGRERIAIGLGSDLSNNYVSYYGVGSGSGAELVSNVILQNEFSRFLITGSPDFSQSRKVIFTGDLNSITGSGLILKEFALFASGPALTGSTWMRNTINNGGSVVFDGALEAQFQSTIEIM